MLEAAAQMLYGLVHARYLITTRGLQALYEKWSAGVYGMCWNTQCEKEKRFVLPIGADIVGQGKAMVYCPACGELYHPRDKRLASLDGAYFGSSAASMFVLQYGNQLSVGTTVPFTPRLYGFRLSPTIREEVKRRKEERRSKASLVDNKI